MKIFDKFFGLFGYVRKESPVHIYSDKELYEPVPEWIQKGVRVEVTKYAGFHKGAKGVVEFIQPRGTLTSRVWVIRDGASSAVWYWPVELMPLESEATKLLKISSDDSKPTLSGKFKDRS